MTTGTDADAATALGPALWDAMLNLRTAAMPARASDALLHTDMLGWQPHARFSDAEQAGFPLYKPLLDPATSAATGRPWPWTWAQASPP